jgi:very-short-patch-repair endonuclease
MYGYDFHRKKPIDNYILDFLSRIDAWDWSRWLFSWILEVYEKDGVKEKRMNELGIAVLRF